MKKLLKCLCLLLVVPVISVFALTGCKDKKSNPNDYMSYSEAKSIINSVHQQIYGNDTPSTPPPVDTSGNTPVDQLPDTKPETSSVSDTAYAASSNDVKIVKDSTLLQTHSKNSDNFQVGNNNEVKVNDNYYLYIDNVLNIPIKFVKCLLDDGFYDLFGKDILFKYEDKVGFEPSSLECKIRVDVYQSALVIKMHRATAGETIDTCIINLVFDSNLKVTNVLYATIRAGESSDVFAFATYETESQKTSVLKIDETTTSIQTQIKNEITSFEAVEGTLNTTIDFAATYVQFL